MQTLDLVPDIEIDIEELLGEDERAHAILFCPEHAGAEWMPVSGTIVETICGILKRVNNEKEAKDMCEPCERVPVKGKPCYVCGKGI